MNRILALAILVGVGAYLYSTGAFASISPYVSNPPPAPPLPVPDENGQISDPVYNPPIPTLPAN